MSGARILVVEDDSAIRRGIVDALEFAGYEALQAGNGNEGMTQGLRGTFDLLLLDLILPGHSGFEILKAAREARPTLPIIILTALGEEADKIAALNQGADDYLTKPFGVGELLARVQAVLRRASWADTPRSVGTQRFGNIEIDFEQRQVWRDSERVRFTPTEFSLLQELALHPGKIFTHETLLRRVWGTEHSRDAEYLRVYIGRLRRKIEIDSSKPLHILTEPGIGYYLIK